MSFHYDAITLIIFFAFLPNLLAAILAAVKYRQVKRPLKVLCLSVFFALLIELVSRAPWLFYHSNLFLWPVYLFVEFGLLLWMYSLVLEKQWLLKSRLFILLAFFCILLVESFFKAYTFQNAARLVETCVVITLIIAYFYKTFQELKVQNLWRDSIFIASSGLLIFFASNLFIYLFINFSLQYSQSLNDRIWMVHAGLSGLLYVSYTIALWVSPKK